MFGGAFGIWQWVIVLVIVLLLFGGRGKISSLMGDFGKGLRNFKSGMNGDENDASQPDDEEELIEDVTDQKPAAKKPAARKPRSTAAKKTTAKKTVKKATSRKKTTAK